MENTKDNLTKIGYDAAKKLEQADNKATSTKRDIVLKLAMEYAQDDSKAKAVLDGIEKYHLDQKHSDSFARRIKSEIKSVIDAVAKTLVSGENVEKLAAFSGTWHEWIGFARTLRGKKEGNAGSRNTGVRALSDTGYEKLQEGMKKATPAQIIALAADAATIVDTTKPTAAIGGKVVSIIGVILLKQIRVIAGRLANSTDAEQAFKTIGQQIYDLTNKVIDSHEKAVNEASRDMQQRAEPVAQVA